MNRWILGAVAGAISLMVAVGCGGGDGETTTVALSKAAFKKQANAICKKREAERETVFSDYGKEVEAAADGGKVTAQIERNVADEMIAESIVPSMEEQMEQLNGLGPPAGDEAKVEKILESMSAAVADLEKRGAEGLVSGIKLQEFQDEAKAYGLECTI